MSFLSLQGILGSRVGCSKCHEGRGEDVFMEPTQAWHPSLMAYVDAWECPECGHTTVRGEDPTITNASGEQL